MIAEKNVLCFRFNTIEILFRINWKRRSLTDDKGNKGGRGRGKGGVGGGGGGGGGRRGRVEWKG